LNAKEAVANKYAADLKKMIGQAPIIPSEYERSDEDEDQGVRVLACIWGEPCVGVVVSGTGEVIDTLQLNYMKFSATLDNRAEAMQKQADLTLLKDFVVKHRPNILAVGATGFDSRRLWDDLTRYENSSLDNWLIE